MCGIAGIIARDGSTPVRREDLASMAAAMRHRGPDAEGRLIEGSVGLTMRRLAVIDLEHGDQPIWNEDRSVAIVQNGEIYNYKELRDDLRGRGHKFSTSSDTEAVVHLYEETGPTEEFANGIWGMFALALLDLRRGVVVLARDRLGKKPLTLFEDPETFAFASELPSLSAVPWIRDRMEIEPRALDAYLAVQYVPGPGTMFRRVRQVPPGELQVLERTGRGWQAKPAIRYWSVERRIQSEPPAPESFRQSVDRCEGILRDAVKRRLMSDVPLGAFLSGGVDSSLLVALMKQHAPDQVQTFSIGFEDAEFDESDAADRVARFLGTDHHMLKMPTPSPDQLQTILGAVDQPLADPAIVPTWFLSRMTRENVTVALSGEGADELFGGYHWYRKARRRRSAVPGRRNLTPLEFYRLREKVSVPERARLLANPLSDDELWLASQAHLAAAPMGLPPMGTYQTIDVARYMGDDLLVKVDRMSMAHSLEVRCPFLDHRLVEAALPLPDNFKIRWGRRKAIVRAIAARYLPRDVVHKKKHGFMVPIDSLMRTAYREMLGDLTARDRLARQGLFNPEGISELLSRWERDACRSDLVWQVLCFQLWLETQA